MRGVLHVHVMITTGIHHEGNRAVASTCALLYPLIRSTCHFSGMIFAVCCPRNRVLAAYHTTTYVLIQSAFSKIVLVIVYAFRRQTVSTVGKGMYIQDANAQLML